MIGSISILIPCYNGTCVDLVRSLQAQAERLSGSVGLSYEIIVADDGSTDRETVRANMEIGSIGNCRYITRLRNCGRAAIRNFLAGQAAKEWLLFLDCDMVVRNDGYLAGYVRGEHEPVTYGGYVVNGDAESLRGNLRYRYETRYGGNSSAKTRKRNPYRDFHTSNFLVRRDVMARYPLDERFRKYGYEDVLWGKTLLEGGITIGHVDNPVSFEKFEDNPSFLAKTEEGMETLRDFEEELRGYSTIIDLASRLERLHLLGIVAALHALARGAIKKNLEGNKPSVFLFNIYKMGTFCHLRKRGKHGA